MRTESTSPQNCTIGVKPSIPWRVTKATPLEGFRLFVAFKDGTSGYVDLSQLVHSDNAGVFTALKDREYFNQVYVEHGVVTWPDELDLAPDAMYYEIKKNGEWIIE